MRRKTFAEPREEGGRLIVVGTGGDRLRIRPACCDGGGVTASVEVAGKTEEIGGRDLRRAIDVGIVSRNAAGLDDGVEGRVGGTCVSIEPIRPVEFECVRARDEAVAAE